METPTHTVPPVDLNRLVRRFEVQQRCPLQGWNTWVIYDEKRHAVEECARRISEAALRDKNNWRVVPSQNTKIEDA
jgi:predicted P-loop ATPase/GTPase